MLTGGEGRRGGTTKFVIALIAILATIAVAIEWARRVKAPDNQSPQVEIQPDRPFPRTLTDAAGEKLVIASRPNKIVSQALATDEILLAICAVDRIAALSSLAEDENYSNVVEPARRVAGRTTQGAEQILLLKPDLIFVASYSRAETVQQLKSSQAPVFRFANFNSIADIQTNILTVGHAVGNDEEAKALAKKMDDALSAIRSRVPTGRPALRVLSFGQGGFTVGKNTTFDDIVRAAGAVNVAAENGIGGFAKISVEKVAEWDPDFIVAGANRGEIASVRKNLLANPVIAVSRAGRAGQIIIIDNRHFLTVSQYIVDCVEDLADGLYGKRN